MLNIEKPKYLVTNPIHSCFKFIPIQKEYQFFIDIFDEVRIDRISVPLKIYKIPNSNNISNYTKLHPYLIK
jgi:hypothetical protein